jgi:hypothetical protein
VASDHELGGFEPSALKPRSRFMKASSIWGINNHRIHRLTVELTVKSGVAVKPGFRLNQQCDREFHHVGSRQRAEPELLLGRAHDEDPR